MGDAGGEVERCAEVAEGLAEGGKGEGRRGGGGCGGGVVVVVRGRGRGRVLGVGWVGG